MNLYRPSNRKSSGRPQIVFGTAVVIVLFIIDSISGGFIRHEIRTAASYGLRASQSVSRAVVLSGFFSSRSALESTIASQQALIAHLQEQASAYLVIKQENDALRSLVHLAATSPGVTAPILSSFHESPYGTFVVGVGAAEGVVQGNLVVSEGGFVIGRVTNVDTHTSLVTQLLTPGSSVDARIGGATVVVEGRGSGNAVAKTPHGVTITEGDPVIAPTLGGRPIGIVGNVDSTVAGAYSTVYIGLPMNLSGLEFVYVEK